MPAPRQKVRWTREATRDVREIWRYYARVASAEVANKLILKLIEVVHASRNAHLHGALAMMLHRVCAPSVFHLTAFTNVR